MLKCLSNPMPTLASLVVLVESNTPRTEVFRQETCLESRPNPLDPSGVESHRCDLRPQPTALAPRRQSLHRPTWTLIDHYLPLVSVIHLIVATLLPYPMLSGMFELARYRRSVRIARHSGRSGSARNRKSSQHSRVRKAVCQSVDGSEEHPSQAVTKRRPMKGTTGDQHQVYQEMMLCLLFGSLPMTKWLSMMMSLRMRVRYRFPVVSGLMLRS